MFKVTVKWWLRAGRKMAGTDTFLTETAEVDEDAIMDIMNQSDTYTEELKTKLPNFYWKHVCCTGPEDWGVTKLTIVEAKQQCQDRLEFTIANTETVQIAMKKAGASDVESPGGKTVFARLNGQKHKRKLKVALMLNQKKRFSQSNLKEEK